MQASDGILFYTSTQILHVAVLTSQSEVGHVDEEAFGQILHCMCHGLVKKSPDTPTHLQNAAFFPRGCLYPYPDAGF